MTKIEQSEHSFINPLNKRVFFYRIWRPENPISTLIIVHGFAEHSGRYQKIANFLAQNQIMVICPDLWGHGHSGGRRGDIRDLNECLDDLAATTEHILTNKIENLKTSLLGHSFGGLLAYLWVIKNPNKFNCLILESPLFGLGFQPPVWKDFFANAMSKLLPMFKMPLGLNPASLSHDNHVVESYKKDPLVHGCISARCYAQLKLEMKMSLEKTPYLKTPTLMMCAEKDQVVSIDACNKIFEKLACEKQIIKFSECYHEIHNESAFEELGMAIISWMRKYA
jgi:alpha-beta hydrolase superfamily lysophospholipase